MRAIRLKTDHLTDPIGISATRPVLSWNCEDGTTQTAWQVVVTSGGKTVWDSGKTPSSSMQTVYGGEILASRDAAVWKVRLWDENNTPGPWSDEAHFELGLLSAEAWIAKWIDPELPHDTNMRQPASYLRKFFALDSLGTARLYATAHGIYDVWLNGIHVDGYLLAPGNCQVHRRLQVQTYDVTDFLRNGENELLVTLGDGWYRGSVAYNMDVNTFGTDIALLLQLEVNGTVVAATDENWQASSDGPLGLNDHMKGERYDARKWPINRWHSVMVRNFGYDNLTGTDTVPVTAHESFPAAVLYTPSGEAVLDFGQNIAGYVEFRLHAKAGQKIILTHGETLDAQGNFTIENFQNPGKKECFQRVEYICQEGKNHYRPTKCYFGFRYVKVEGDVPVDGIKFTARAIYSDMVQTGLFHCGNDNINQLFQNALWSMKGNFVDVPTDCPTREKSGYSGDCQVFSHTAMYMMDCYPVLRKWLGEQAATQFEDGCVRQIAPENRPRDLWDGGAGWCDSFELVPWRMAKRYGDDTILRELYGPIRSYMLFCLERNKKTHLWNLTLPKGLRSYFADQGMHWGEWLEPGSEGMKQNLRMAKHFIAGASEEATAFLSYGCHAASQMAHCLDKSEDARFFAEAAEKARAAYRLRYLKNGRIRKSSRQCRYVRPLAMGLLDADERQTAADDLAENIHRNGNRLNTGFLSTHELCRVLTDHGHADTAYDLLLQAECPGWLYAVNKGATTIWESWDGIDERGEPHNSMNHYSYGAVVGWLFDRVCGIRLENGHIIIRPYPDRRLKFAEAIYTSPYGEIRSGWRYCDDSKVSVIVSIPVNCRGELILPDGSRKELTPGSHTVMYKE